MEQTPQNTGYRDTRTREQLCAALRTLLCTKPLDQIRVREVAEQCGIRRQSFYYHFADVYELFEWSVEREREQLRIRQESCLTVHQALRDLLRYTEENRTYYLALWRTPPRQLRRALGGAAEVLARRMTEYYTRRAGEVLTPEQLCARTEVAAGVLLSLLEAWVCGELTQPPEQLCSELERWICQAALGAAWKNQGR